MKTFRTFSLLAILGAVFFGGTRPILFDGLKCSFGILYIYFGYRFICNRFDWYDCKQIEILATFPAFS